MPYMGFGRFPTPDREPREPGPHDWIGWLFLTAAAMVIILMIALEASG